MSVIAKYTCNESGVVPTFNYGYVYETNETESNGIYTVEITSDTLPTSINFISSSIIELIYLNISNITDFTDMFHDCNNLATVNTSDWDTSRVTSMSSMFNFCHRLTNIDVSNWDTSNVTNMNVMFSNCNALTELDVSNFDTSNVTDMQGMFYNCSNLISLDLSNFDTSKVTNMSEMFIFCKNLTSIGMLYSNKETVEKIQSFLPNVNNLQRTIWVQDTNEKDYASNEYVIFKEYGFEKQKVRLPQPLMKIGDCKDKLYWDNEKGKYCIEQWIYKYTVTDVSNWNIALYSDIRPNKYMYHIMMTQDEFNKLYSQGDNTEIEILSNKFANAPEKSDSYNHVQDADGIEFIYKELIWTDRYGLTWGIHSSKLESEDVEQFRSYLASKVPFDLYFILNEPTIIETDITEKIALNTYNPYMKVTTNEKEIAPTNMVARFPYKDYFGNDVTVNNLSTDLGSVYKLNLDFNRGDYLEAKIDLSNINTNFQVALGFLDTDSIENCNSILVLGFIKYDEMSGIYFQTTTGTDYEVKTIETTDNIIKFKIDEKGIYINDIYTNPFDNQDLFNYLLENIKNLNICYLHNVGDISFDYIKTVQQNSDGDDIGHLGKYNHYYQTYTNYPIAVESEDLCYIHDSYITEVYGNTVQDETDLSDIQSTGQLVDEKYRIKFNISSCPVKFGGGK